MLYTEKWDNRKAWLPRTASTVAALQGKYRAAEVELSAPGEMAELSAIAKTSATRFRC